VPSATAQRDDLTASAGTGGCWLVERPQPSRRHARFYLVRIAGHRLQCDCLAATFGRVCCHRGTVHLAVVARVAKHTAPSS
jgi:hypothetical protein